MSDRRYANIGHTHDDITSGPVDHGSLTGLGDDDHTQYHTDARGDLRYPPLARLLTAGSGLIGGGDLSADRTFNVGAGTGITVNADDIETDDAAIDHDALLNFVSNEHINHTSVNLTAGNGLSGGGDISANRTFTVNTADSLTISSDSIRLVGDAASPGNDKLYGTNGSGTKGWYDQPSGGGGATYVVLGSDHTNSTTTPTVALNFTPAANTKYLIEWFSSVESALSNVQPQVGFRWNTGNNMGVGGMHFNAVDSGAAGTVNSFYEHNIYDGTNKFFGLATGNIGNREQPCWGWAIIDVGGSPSGDIEITLDSASGGTTVTMKAGSNLRYTVL